MLRRHNVIGPSVSLASNDGHFGNGGLCKRIQELGAMADDTPVLLGGPGEEARHVHQSNDGDVEAVGKPHHPGRLCAGVDVQDAGKDLGLVGNHAHRLALHAAQPHNHVLGPVRHDLVEGALVQDRADHVLHVVRHVRIRGDDVVQRLAVAVPTVGGPQGGAVRVLVGLRQVAHEPAELVQRLHIVRVGPVAHPRHRRVGLGAAELLLSHLFVCDRLDDVRARHEHVRTVVDHEDEVGHRG
mmetsp:Transcript_48047/g.80727  ORF Transcript_48047/g.80727 Transcript_48047/m.80727 type:complete len:241 (+) Transcript_48047:481-1203(+)